MKSLRVNTTGRKAQSADSTVGGHLVWSGLLCCLFKERCPVNLLS